MAGGGDCSDAERHSQGMYNIMPLCGSNIAWPEILAGRYFGGLLKICHWAEFTLAVEPVLVIMIFITRANRMYWKFNWAVS